MTADSFPDAADLLLGSVSAKGMHLDHDCRSPQARSQWHFYPLTWTITSILFIPIISVGKMDAEGYRNAPQGRERTHGRFL